MKKWLTIFMASWLFFNGICPAAERESWVVDLYLARKGNKLIEIDAKKKKASIWIGGEKHRSKEQTDTKVTLIDGEGKEIESTFVNYMFLGKGLDELPSKKIQKKERPDGAAVLFFKLDKRVKKIIIQFRGTERTEILIDSLKELK
jgi:hypothetical protein